MTIITG